MKNKVDLFLLALMVPVDFIMIVVGGLFAYYLRLSSFVVNIRPVQYIVSLREYFIALLFVAVLAIFVFMLNDLYLARRRPFFKILASIFFATITTLMLVIVYLFFIKETFTSRFVVLFAWLAATFFIIIGRVWLLFLRRYLYSNDFGLKKIVLVGDVELTENMKDYLKKNRKKLGYKVVTVINNYDTLLADLNRLLKENQNIAEIWQCDAKVSRSESVKLIDFTIKNHLLFKYVTGHFESRTTNIDVNVINSFPLVELRRTSLQGWGRILKRFIDIIGAICGIIIFSPIMIITAIIIKLTSKGPIIADIPERAGQYGKPFKFFKFRSMYVGAHKDQEKFDSDRDGLFKLKDDPRITKVGHFIRKWSIDELPQFFNVLFGNMSLVGPRPHYTYEYKEKHKRVLALKPGITGVGQISGRSDLSFDEEVKLDLYYMEHWSIWLDIWVILRTPIAILKNRKAS